MLDAYAQEKDELGKDDLFTGFEERCALCPDQVFRFPENSLDYNPKPLWCGSQSRIKLSEIPPCPYCSAPRIFEFQVLPQLLSDLGELNLDWSNLCVYTCPNSCGEDLQFYEEF